MARKQTENAFQQLFVWVDFFLVILAFILAIPLRNELSHILPILNETPINDLGASRWMAFVIVIMIPMMLWLQGFYRQPHLLKIFEALRHIAKSLITTGAFVAFGAIIAQLPIGNRGIITIATILAISFILSRWLIWRKWLSHKASRRQNLLSVLVVGSKDQTESYLKSLGECATKNWSITSSFDLKSNSIQDMQKTLVEHSIQRVIFASTHIEYEKLCHAIQLCEIQGIEIWSPMDFLPLKVAQPSFAQIGGESILIFSSTNHYTLGMSIKTLFDKIAALLLILGTSPLWIIAAIGIKRSDPGPIFYRQERSGRYGKPFRMWKFRSMYIDADKHLQEVKANVGNDMDGPVFKIDNDPRIFSFGHFLRKTSIDELPQLLNVLMGDMSLVGPRPLPVYEVEAFPRIEDRRRLCIKPGITCYWQIEGRSSITNFEQWVDLDCRYIDNWSLGLDFILLLRTIPAVLLRRGAK